MTTIDLPVPVAPKRTAQISPDRWIVGIFAVLLVTVVMVASMAFSYVAIAEAGAWAGVPGLSWLAPVFIDGAIIAYTVALSVFEARNSGRRTIWFSRGVLWGFSLLSVVLNFAHTASYWEWDFRRLEAWFGCLIAVAAPVSALLSAEVVVQLVFKRHGFEQALRAAEVLREQAAVASAATQAAPAATEKDDEPASAPAPAPALVAGASAAADAERALGEAVDEILHEDRTVPLQVDPERAAEPPQVTFPVPVAGLGAPAPLAAEVPEQVAVDTAPVLVAPEEVGETLLVR